MKILHIAKIRNSPFFGTSVVIPQHIKYQRLYADTFFINVSNEIIDDVNQQLYYSGSIMKSINDIGGVDIVVFHEFYRKEYLRIYRKLIKHKIPYIILPHGCFTKEAQNKKRFKKFLGNILFRGFLNNSLAIQFLSKNESHSFCLPYKNTTFIGTNGVAIKEKNDKSFNISFTRFIYIGRLEVYIKGIDLLIQAISRCKNELKENRCSFDIYGPDILGRGEEIKKMISAYNVGDIIFLHNEISGEQKINALYASDIFIQTSRTEGMPSGILEALSYGLPVLITEGTNLKEEVEEYAAGIVCENNVDSLIAGLMKMLAMKEKRYSMSNNAVKLVRELFDWEIVCEKTVKKYKELVQESK